MPLSLVELKCAYNKLKTLPDLSKLVNLREVHCNNNQITNISNLPDFLHVLYCQNQSDNLGIEIFQITIDRLPDMLIELRMDGVLPHFPWCLTYYNSSDKKATIVKQQQHAYRKSCIGDESSSTYVQSEFYDDQISILKREWDHVWKEYNMWLFRLDGPKYNENIDFIQYSRAIANFVYPANDISENDDLPPLEETLPGNNNYPIRWASVNGHLELVRLLLEDSRVDPSSIANAPIRYASENGHVDVVRLLLTDPRVDPSAEDNYAIRFASHYGHVDVVRLLLEDSRVDPTAEDNDAIRWARVNDHSEIVELLTEHQYRLDGPEYTRGIL
jgi:hypothetical protein